jgi:pimeloyl-ACP methyl ester carboxylesterase
VLCATLPGNGKATDPSAAAASQLADPSKASNILDLLFPASQPKAAKEFLAQIIQFPHFYIASPAVDKLQLGVLGLWLTGKDAAGLRINQISAPTLVADGLDDLLVPTANDRELTSVIKGAKLQLYPDAGHGFLFQDEPQFLAVLEGFLAR